MKQARVLVLVHKHLIPPDAPAAEEIPGADWKMEWDVVSTLRKRGHELRVIGVSDDLSPIRPAIDEFQPTIVFNLMEAFADVGVFDQNVVSYLELLRVPYTGCNPRGLTLSRDKGAGQEAHGLPPHSGARLRGRAARQEGRAAEEARLPADREVAHLRSRRSASRRRRSWRATIS